MILLFKIYLIRLEYKPIRILYGIQGTGNGHISRSIIIIEQLYKYLPKDSIDILISGSNYSLQIPFAVKYQYEGISFSYGSGGKISFAKSLRNFHPKKIKQDYQQIDFSKYDLIITDQEPISAWGAKKNRIASVGIGNIYSMEITTIKRLFLQKYMTKLFQRLYCPVENKIVLDFTKSSPSNFYPVISKEMICKRIKNHDFTLVYLLSYSVEEIVKILSHHLLQDQIFVVYTKEVDVPVHYNSIHIKPISKNSFQKDLANCRSIITTAGFQTIAEAIFAKKKLFLLPIKGQPEQKANAIMLRKYEIASSYRFSAKKIARWLQNQSSESLSIIDETQQIIEKLLSFIPNYTLAIT